MLAQNTDDESMMSRDIGVDLPLGQVFIYGLLIDPGRFRLQSPILDSGDRFLTLDFRFVVVDYSAETTATGGVQKCRPVAVGGVGVAAVITVSGSRKLETDDGHLLQLAAAYPTEPPEVCSYHNGRRPAGG